MLLNKVWEKVFGQRGLQEVHFNCTESRTTWRERQVGALKIHLDRLLWETKTQHGRWKSKSRGINDKIPHQPGSAGPQKPTRECLIRG